LFQIGRQHVREQQLAMGLALFQQAILVMQRLFDRQLTDVQLNTMKRQLEDTVEALRGYSLAP